MEMSEITSGLRRMNLWHIALCGFLLFLFIFLSVRASDEYRWSDWGFGDAQSMLSLRQWEEEGWFKNYFLFIPQGYAKVIRFFDEPELRHHAHGTCPGSSPGVGPRLWYTHYPSGYLVPYAILFKMGIYGIFFQRMLSIVFSISALILMFILFSRVASRATAFIAVFFYGLSSAFLGYADTIANQPLDDLLRFGFMTAVVFSTRAESLRQRKAWMISAWIMEFVLSLSSFDSVFFVFVWLIGWDILDQRVFRWKTYLVYALAPLTAHGLQFFQNVWYLGWDNTLKDIEVTFLQKAGSVQGYGDFSGGRLSLIFMALTTVFENLFKPEYLFLILLFLYVFYMIFLKEKGDTTLPSVRLLLLLFVCGLAYVAILPHGARMPYQARQMAPFTACLAGGITWSFARGLRQGIRGNPEGAESGATGVMRKLIPVYLFVTAIMLIVFWYRFSLYERYPTYKIPEGQPDASAREIDPGQHPYLMASYQLRDDIIFIKELRTMRTRYEPVIFSIGALKSFWDPNYVPGYPQINPIVEFYAGSRPVLCFLFPEGLASDLLYMTFRSPYKFSPVLIADDNGRLEEVLHLLLSHKGMRGAPPGAHVVMGKYVLDLTDYLRWRVDEAN